MVMFMLMQRMSTEPIFTIRYEVAKVMFLHLSVILFTGGSSSVLPLGAGTQPGAASPRTRHPPGSRHPPGADTSPSRSIHPPDQAPFGSRHLPTRQMATVADDLEFVFYQYEFVLTWIVTMRNGTTRLHREVSTWSSLCESGPAHNTGSPDFSWDRNMSVTFAAASSGSKIFQTGGGGASTYYFDYIFLKECMDF